MLYYAKLILNEPGVAISSAEAAASAGTLLAHIASLTYPNGNSNRNGVFAGPLLPGPGGFFLQCESVRQIYDGPGEDPYYENITLGNDKKPISTAYPELIVEYEAAIELDPTQASDDVIFYQYDGGSDFITTSLVLYSANKFVYLNYLKVWAAGEPVEVQFWTNLTLAAERI